MRVYASAIRTYLEVGNVTTDFAVLLDDGGSGVQRKLALVGIDLDDANVVRVAISAALVSIYGDVVTPPEVTLATPSGTDVSGAGATTVFRGDGYYRVSTSVDVNELVNDLWVQDVILRRTIAGTSGYTEVDILVNGVSLWSLTPANRPKILFSDGDDARVVSGPPDDSLIPAGSRIEMSILVVEGGNPQDLIAILQGA